MVLKSSDYSIERVLNDVWNNLLNFFRVSVTDGTTSLVINADGSINVSDTAKTTIVNGQTTTNAATAVVIKTDTAIKSVSIRALSTNTGLVYVGNATVDSANGFELEAGDSVDLDVDNTNRVYVDVSVNGEGISYIATV